MFRDMANLTKVIFAIGDGKKATDDVEAPTANSAARRFGAGSGVRRRVGLGLGFCGAMYARTCIYIGLGNPSPGRRQRRIGGKLSPRRTRGGRAATPRDNGSDSPTEGVGQSDPLGCCWAGLWVGLRDGKRGEGVGCWAG